LFYRDNAGVWRYVSTFAPDAIGNPAIVSQPNGTLDVIVRTSDGYLTRFYRDVTTGIWYQSSKFGNTTIGDPSATYSASGTVLNVAVQSNTGAISHYTAPYNSGTWTLASTFGQTQGKPSLTTNVSGSLNLTVPGSGGGINFYYQNPGASWTYDANFAFTTGRGAVMGTYGASGDEPYPGDYDGDSKADLSVIRRGMTDSQGYFFDTWYIKRSSDGVSVSYNFSDNPSTTPFRPRGFLVPGDYDGDGKLDPAIERLSVNGSNYSADLFYIASSNGSTVRKSMVVPPGAQNITYWAPFTGDFDGDGKSDLAGFSATDNRVQYLSSASGGTINTASGCGYGLNTIVSFTPQGVRAAYGSPVLIDTKGDGFDLSSVGDGVSFDFQGYGQTVKSSWTAAGSNDAFLVLDRNRNGKIDSGLELFGNETVQAANVDPNGFLALSMFDQPAKGGNGDGKIDASDQIFSDLRLWIDANHDGISQPSELLPVTDKGIFDFDLKYKESKRVDRYGNQFRFRAKVLDSRGAQNGKWAWDVFFQRDTTTSPDGTTEPSKVQVSSKR
jgi:hypothetical protein